MPLHWFDESNPQDQDFAEETLPAIYYSLEQRSSRTRKNGGSN